MNTCYDEETITRLMNKHEGLATAHSHMVDHHRDRVLVLNEYLKELTKPGFKQKNRIITVSPRSKSDTIITAGNTWGE